MRTIEPGEQKTSIETTGCAAMKIATVLLLFLPFLVAGCSSLSVAIPSPTLEIVVLGAGGDG